MFVMGVAIALRDDYDGPGLRRLARAVKDAGQSRRCLALAEIYDGGTRSDAARMSSVGLQVIRDWVLRFNADGPDGLIDRKASGPSPKLNNEQRRALGRVVENGPIPAIHGVVRWRLKDLAHWIAPADAGSIHVGLRFLANCCEMIFSACSRLRKTRWSSDRASGKAA
jgi:transposase